MSEPNRIYGKVSSEFFRRVIYPNLGKSRNEVLVGPTVGVDTSVVKIASNEVLVATTDPVSFIPELGAKDSAWLSVNLIASDLATSGFHPQYAIFDLNLPPTMSDSELEDYWREVSLECENLGISIIGGHTGRFEGLDYTIIGAGSMYSIGSSNAYLTSKDASIGDRLIVTKGAAIAATGILSRVFPETVGKAIGDTLLNKSSSYLKKTTVVDEALTAVKVGIRKDGVSAMHDATEGGVLSAVYELANASSLGAQVDQSKIPISEETKEICKLFEIDPFTSLGEGSLLIACNPSKSVELLSVLNGAEITAADIGVLVAPNRAIKVTGADGREMPIKYPVTDPYWNAYYKGKRKRWT